MLVALIAAEVRPGGPGARGKGSQAQTFPPTPLGPARWGFGDPDTARGAKNKKPWGNSTWQSRMQNVPSHVERRPGASYV